MNTGKKRIDCILWFCERFWLLTKVYIVQSQSNKSPTISKNVDNLCWQKFANDFESIHGQVSSLPTSTSFPEDFAQPGLTLALLVRDYIISTFELILFLENGVTLETPRFGWILFKKFWPSFTCIATGRNVFATNISCREVTETSLVRLLETTNYCNLAN